ncbi:MAG: cupin domain-containing protein [Anaerolineae bacterium]|uniref:Cupin domain-containing protein n=1 Tax=Candidatus Desulfolinea nitratireducens TaxID=2841698 RepID=A0A8J6NL82_9CHLR|nr:cupin domain-containing protein [Candidatus Desulfolinea nitratireducens]NQU30173.1 cupin domain-containing protein [Anaerolineae bacterium]
MTETKKAEILNIADLATYQENAVVSSQILRAETGNVTLFAFDKGQELSEHSTPFDALVQVLDGKAEIVISGNSYHMGAGESIILPADKPHAVIATAQFKMLLTMIRA